MQDKTFGRARHGQYVTLWDLDSGIITVFDTHDDNATTDAFDHDGNEWVRVLGEMSWHVDD